MPRKPNTPIGVNARGLSFDGLPLFRWANSRPAASPTIDDLPRAAKRLAQRFRLLPTHARIIAELAGFSLEIKNV